ncbi:MAG: hypothetical protein EA396_14240 [Anaerolineaceae bacterium]|nr:MAG: hypothetical protein EA396_14240 [Anaerolineaceae bacterium]
MLGGLLTACGALDQQEINATLVSGDFQIETEVALANATVSAERRIISATIEANEAQVASARSANATLGAMVDASNPAVPTLRVGALPMPDFEHLYAPDEVAPFWPGVVVPEVAGFPTLESWSLFAAPSGVGADIAFTGLTDGVGDDNCVLNPRTTFFAQRDGRIMYTMRLRDVPAGTRLNIVWEHEGTVRWRESWDINSPITNECRSFVVTQSDMAFTPGTWIIYLYANNTLVVDPATFRMDPS